MATPKKQTQEEPKLQQFTEVGYSQSVLYEQSNFKPYNPDDLVRKFGGNSAGLRKYEAMRRDDAVKAALYTKKAALLASGWRIDPATDDDQGKEIADFITNNLIQYYEGNFESGLWEVLSAMDFGYSVTEKIYDIYDGKVYLKELKTRPPHTFEFHLDPHGNFLQNGFKQWTEQGSLIPLPLENFIIFTHNKEFSNLYGESDLRAAYRSWWSKDNLIKFWNIYLERFGNPLMIAKYGKTTNSTERANLQDMLDNLQAKTSFVMPNDVELDIKESMRNSGGDYDKAIEMHNTSITRSILMPNLLGFGQTGGGSYALGKTQFDVLLWILEKVRRELENVINEHIIRPLVEMNFGDQEAYPLFKFNPIYEEDKNTKADLIIKAIQSGAIQTDLETENHIRTLLGMPEKAVEDILPVANPIVTDPKEPAETKTFAFRRAFTSYEKRMDFSLIKKNLTTDIDGYIDGIKETLRKIRDDYTTQILRKKLIETQNVAMASKLDFKYIGELGLQIEGILRKGSESGRKIAKDTYKKSYAQNATKIGLVPSKASMWIKAQSQILTSKIADDLDHKVKSQLMDGISKGLSPAQVVHNIEAEFEKYVATEGFEGSTETSDRLYTEVNTTYAKAYASGMEEYNKELEVEGEIVAYQWSSILDDATTEGCKELDGAIYGIDNPIWNQIQQPRHWNCRSLKVPIFKGETWTESAPTNVKTEF